MREVVRLSLTLLLTFSQSLHAFTPEQYAHWFTEAYRGSLTIPWDVASKARGMRYVFVKGFLSEVIPTYFARNRKELRKLGVPAEQIHVISPCSGNGAQKNCPLMKRQLEDLTKLGPEPLVLIGHSRGALGVMDFLLRSPDFVERWVEAAFLIQGPFGGSGIADYLLGVGPPPGAEFTKVERKAFEAAAKAEKWLFSDWIKDSLPDLLTKRSQAYWKSQLAAHRDAIPKITDRIHYIRSHVRPNWVRDPLKGLTGKYLQENYGPNDGLVALRGQSLPEVGTVIATVSEACHSDLTHTFPMSRRNPRLRVALAQSLFVAVGQP